MSKIDETGSADGHEARTVLIRIAVTVVITVALRLLPLPDLWYVRLALFAVPYFIVAYDVLWEAILGIAHGEVFDENFLMTVAGIGAMALGDYTEAIAVMLFYKVGELFEDYATDRSRKNIADLMDIRPDYARVLRDDEETATVAPDSVAVGSTVVVQPGEKIPIDGVVTEGESSLNTSALTGESLPRDVGIGDEVVSGCVSTTGLLYIRTTKPFGESTVSRILDLVEHSDEKKARSENFITRFARIYTPVVCIGALALAVVPSLIGLIVGGSADWIAWITRALTVLVISCPCALVISIPLSFFGGIGAASARGILVKGSNYLEALSATGYCVMDKTGTLTKGSFEVTALCPAPSVSDAQLLETAAYAECYSSHPIALSLTAAYGQGIDRLAVTDVESINGLGLTALVRGSRVHAGNAKLMRQLGITAATPVAPGTEVHVALDGRYLGYILISDAVKPGAAEAISDLRAAGVEHVVMLTGDSERVADAVAAGLGIDEVRANLLPEDKVAEVERLLSEKPEGVKLVFVGDGINDAPVLRRADIGVAMGALGSDAAIEAADIVLMDDDPRKIAVAIRISRKTLKIVRENIAFALTVKIICLAFGAFGLLSMWVAVFADVGVMVLAVINSMRALRA